MERCREIALEISSVSRKVITAANEYAKRAGLPRVPRSHFQLEADIRRISVACDTLAEILGRLPLSDNSAFDIRLQDWFSGEEPSICLDTLSRMEKILQQDAPRYKNTVRGTQSTEDKIREALDFFVLRYLDDLRMTVSLRNNEMGVRRPEKDVSRSLTISTTGSPPVAALANIDATMPAAVQKTRGSMVDGQPELWEKNARNLEGVLRWLDGLNCAEKQDVTLSLRQPDTCKWLFDTAQYKLWRNEKISCLWLRGKPGAGKSVLASFVIDSLENAQQEDVIAFFYCDFRNERSTSASEVLRSLLSQLLRPLLKSNINFGALVDDLVGAKQRGGATRTSTKELVRFVSRTAVLFTRKPLVVVDALDECKDVEALLEGLNELREYAQIFTTSRPLQAIKDGLSCFPFVSMDDMAVMMSADIMLHVTRELDARRRLRVLGTKTKAEICSILCRKADGMFRWIQCSIEALNRCVTLKEVQAALGNLPEGLDETYKRILLPIDIKSQEGQLALRTLVWLVAALRPLRLNELMEALSVNVEKRTLDLNEGPMHRDALLDACGSLVTYTEKTDVVILSHFSVKEYLMSEFVRTELPQYHIRWGDAHLQLARTCMCYISICLTQFRGSASTRNISSEHNSPTHRRPYPLLDYVLRIGVNHFGYFGSRIGSVLDDIKVLEEDITQHSHVWDRCLMLCHTFTNSPLVRRDLNPYWPRHIHDLTLYILITFAPEPLLRTYLLRPTFNLKKQTNPLIYAAYFNKYEHARTLLLRGAKLNRRGWEIDHFQSQALPIEVALVHGRYSMVTFFIAEGSIIPPQIFHHALYNNHRMVPYSLRRTLLQTDDFVEVINDLIDDMELLSSHLCTSFLIHAHIRGQHLKDVVRRIVQAVPEGKHFSLSSYVDSILCTVFEYHHEEDSLEIAKLLASHTFNPAQANSSGRTPLHIAVRRGHISVVQYLISLGVPPPPDLLFVALGLWNTKWGIQTDFQAPMFRLLVENGVSVHVRTEAGDTVLHVALQSLHKEDVALEIAKLLVGYGCSPFEVNSSGKTLIFTAVERAHMSVARYLLSLGVPLPPDILLTPDLHTIWRIAGMFHLLIEHGANVHTRTGAGDSVFHFALASSCHEDNALEIARHLVSYGCDFAEANSSGKTPLHIAIEQDHISVVQYLLSLGVPPPPDILLTSHPYGTWMTAEMVRLLVTHGADVHAHAEDGDTAIHVALKSLLDGDALEVARLLVGYGCDFLETNSSGKTSLHVALEQGHMSVAKYFLSLGVPLPTDILSTLDFQVIRSKAKVVRLLVENGADADVHAQNGAEDSVC